MSFSTFNETLLCKWTNEREAFWNQVVRGKYKEEQGDWCTMVVKDGYGGKVVESDLEGLASCSWQ